MKPFLIATVVTTMGICGFAVAQSKVHISSKGNTTTIVIQCDKQNAQDDCVKWMVTPPIPPTPPVSHFGATANLASIPEIPEMPEMPELPAMPPVPPALPTPPAPPPPPEIPEAVHAACANKSIGQHVEIHIGKTDYYSGTCIKQDGKMRFDAEQISIHRHN